MIHENGNVVWPVSWPPGGPSESPTEPGEDPDSGFGADDAASIGIGFIPIVGSGQSVVELIFGHDYITGEPTSRWLAGAGIVAGMLPFGKGLLKAGAKSADEVADAVKAASKAPVRTADISRKLEYLFGKATGRAHNLERSSDMLRQMERIGLPDTLANRQLMAKHFQDVLNDVTNIAGSGRNGSVIRESLLMGPTGAEKIRSWWEGDKLVTFILEGVGNRFTP